MLKHRGCGTRGACAGCRACVPVVLVTLGMLLGVITPLHAQSLTWLGTLGGNYSWAYGVSADGSVVVGASYNGSGYVRAFRWTQSGGMQDLGTLGGNSSWAYGVSADGSVVVGYAYNVSGYVRAFRWTQSDGMQDLGTLGGRESAAYGVSTDDAVVVGWAQNASYNYRAFRWTQSDGMQDLGTLGGNNSFAYGVSTDGAVVVGTASASTPPYFSHAFRWANGVMQDLGTLGFDESTAYGVSADGSVVVGRMGTDPSPRAFRWTQSGGMENLSVTYSAGLWIAYAISPDGRYIVGYGFSPVSWRNEAFLLDTMVTVTGNVELRDFIGDATQIPVTVELRQGGNVVGSRTLNLDSSGNYAFATYPGTYDLAFKASHWLRTVVPNVSVSGSSVTVNVSLTNGDIDGDNEVTLFDFGGLVAAFGSVPGDSNWNPDADLDGDEEVTLFDFGILVRNFGAIGDE